MILRLPYSKSHITDVSFPNWEGFGGIGDAYYHRSKSVALIYNILALPNLERWAQHKLSCPSGLHRTRMFIILRTQHFDIWLICYSIFITHLLYHLKIILSRTFSTFLFLFFAYFIERIPRICKASTLLKVKLIAFSLSNFILLSAANKISQMP